MTSANARNAEPRRCIRPRNADLCFWGGESMMSVAIKAARYVCGVFISFSLVDSCSAFPGASNRFARFVANETIRSQLAVRCFELCPVGDHPVPIGIGAAVVQT